MEALIPNKVYRQKVPEGWCLTVINCEHCHKGTYNFYIEDIKHDLLDMEDFKADDKVTRYTEGLCNDGKV